MNYTSTSGIEHSSATLYQPPLPPPPKKKKKQSIERLKCYARIIPNTLNQNEDGEIYTQNYTYNQFSIQNTLMILNHYDSTEMDSKCWLHKPSGIFDAPLRSDIQQKGEIHKRHFFHIRLIHDFKHPD